MLGDDIVDAQEPCIGQMLRVYERRGNPVTLSSRSPGSRPATTGSSPRVPGRGRPRRRDHRHGREAGPRQGLSNLAIIGRYLLPAEIFGILAATTPDVGGEIQLTSALKTLLKKRLIDGYLFEGRRYDAGDKLGFLVATVEFALKREDLGGPFREYLKSLKL